MPKNNFYKNGPVACLMLHGFTGSPNELLELGEFLASKNLTVSIPTLPGHGTHSGDMFNYTWKDWFSCVKAEYRVLQESCEEVFVCGLSMGGTLALHLAAHKSVQGVISLAAAVEFPAWKKLGVKYFKSVIKYQHKRSGEDVREQSAKSYLGSYQRFPLYAVDQLFQLVEHVRGDLSEISQPALIMHSKKDHSVKFANSEIVFNSISSKDKRKVDLLNSYHVITVDVEKEQVKDEVIKFIESHSKLLKAETARKKTAKRVTRK